MTPKTFAKYLQRDNGVCWHCGRDGDFLIPQHRMNRGMGGSKSRDKSSNIIVLCSEFNQRIESDARLAGWAKYWGYKLESWQKATEVPVFDFATKEWYKLDDAYGRVVVPDYIASKFE